MYMYVCVRDIPMHISIYCIYTYIYIHMYDKDIYSLRFSGISWMTRWDLIALDVSRTYTLYYG